MKINVKIAIIAFLIVIAINITIVIIEFAGKSSTSTDILQPTATAAATPTSQPGSTSSSDETPTATVNPTAAPGQTTAPTSSSPTPGPTQTATPTATLPGATPTPEPTSTPSGGGTLPTPTTTPTATPTSIPMPTTVVSISTASQVQRDSQFTVDINIGQATYLTFAYFDLSFNANILELEGLTAVNWGNAFNPTIISYFTIEDGLVRVIWDNADWAHNVNNGYGASGSGTLCTAYFKSLNTGTSMLNFVEGQGTPTGELTLISWVACDQPETCVQSEIENVGWTNGSVTVVN